MTTSNSSIPSNAASIVDQMIVGERLPGQQARVYMNGVYSDDESLGLQIDEPEMANPLDVTPTSNLALGWIDEYTDLMDDLTISPREFHQIAGLVTVATAIQRKAWLPMSNDNIYPNIYACIISVSTVFGKSTAIHKPRQMLQAALMDKLVIPPHGSSEGLIKQLSITPSALMIRDEIGTLFGSDKVRYLKDLKQDLTALYDCYPWSRRLSHEEIKVERPYLNILGATTPERFYSNVSDLDWQDGLLPRWLFIVPTGEPDFEKATGMFTQAHTNAINRLAYKLMEIEVKKETGFTLKGDAYECWHIWRTAGLKAAYKQGDENAMAIIGRYAIYALKFAIILAAVNESWGTVTPEIMQTAIQLADNYKANVYQILNESERHRVTGSKLQKVFLVIQKRGNPQSGITIGELMRYANMKQKELKPVLEELNKIRAIMIDDSGRSPRYMTIADKLPLK